MREIPPLMKCGHAANGRDGSGRPVCVICAGIVNGADVPDPDPPSLVGRTARCKYCRKEVPSSASLAFFTSAPHGDVDWYYCGCRGWD